MCQKIVNVLAVASAVVSAAVVGSGLYVYVNRVSIIDGVKSQVLESVTGSLGGGLGGSIGGPTFPTGSNDLSPTAPDQASANPSTGFGIPQ
jgi:hypothetical protein